ncbi:MAG: YqgE/AlgH family protein [Alphaproteobacteria bacterium]|nr:YqgE/AlgH family protein [Alphaproteobacteria bacterium]
MMRHSLRILLPLVVLLVGSASGGIADETGPESFAGKLLVADKSMLDPRFAQTVIYLVRHDEKGAFGLIVNKPLVKIPLADLLRQLDVEGTETQAELDLYFGGPVQGELGFVLHSRDFAAAKATATVQGGYAVSDVRQVLRAISEQKGPEKALFAVGYAGWAAKQLDAELERGDWSVVDADEDLVFDLPVSEKWSAALDRRSLKL